MSLPEETKVDALGVIMKQHSARLSIAAAIAVQLANAQGLGLLKGLWGPWAPLASAPLAPWATGGPPSSAPVLQLAKTGQNWSSVPSQGRPTAGRRLDGLRLRSHSNPHPCHRTPPFRTCLDSSRHHRTRSGVGREGTGKKKNQTCDTRKSQTFLCRLLRSKSI